MNDLPLHLLLPLLASLLLVCGLLCIKRATMHGVTSWTVTFLANEWAAIVFSTLWLTGGTMQPVSLWWQPAIIASLYILGQIFMFSAIQRGDVSVATPVFGIKVVLVAFLVTQFFGQPLSSMVWVGAVLATIGIGLVQWTPPGDEEEPAANKQRSSTVMTVVLAVLSASSFATFDVLVQKWAPAWGAGRFLPMVYWMVAILSLGFLPAFQSDKLKAPAIRNVLLPGTLLIALQAVCIVFTLATFGDAARVNVVYALRAVWGVLLAWLVAITWGGNEATLPRRVMVLRFVGAGLLTVAVILVVTS